ncbi:MAG: hypothetical protein R2827_15225 [Bdellovibrionales bacterium]
MRGYFMGFKPLAKAVTLSFESSPRLYRYNKNTVEDIVAEQVFVPSAIPGEPGSFQRIERIETTNKRSVAWDNRLGLVYDVAPNFVAMAHLLLSHQSFYNLPNYNISQAGMDFLFIVNFNETYWSELFVESLTSNWDKGADLLRPEDTYYYLALGAKF